MNKRTFLVSPSSRKTSYRSRIVGSDDFSCEKEEREKKKKKVVEKMSNEWIVVREVGRKREWEKEKERERMAGSYSHENDGHAWDESHSNGVPTRKVRVSLGER